MSDTPLSIYAALANVMAEVSHVAKRDFNDHHHFNFRGIDAVVNAVGPALRTHSVIVVPQVRAINYEKVTTANGKPATACRVQVAYVFYGPAGDHIESVVIGEAWDNGDKAAPKAMSVAFRTALLQALALPTDDRDPDHQVYERGEADAAQITNAQMSRIGSLMADLGVSNEPDQLAAATEAAGRPITSPWQLTLDEATALEEALQARAHALTTENGEQS